MILVCGEALIDFTPKKFGDEIGYVPHPGGSPFNVAITLGRLKADVSFFGKISYDIFGEMLFSFLKENNVDTRYLLRGREPTTLAFVIIGPDNEPHFVFYGDNSADSSIRSEELPYSFSSDIALMHFGSISLIREPGASTLESLMEREKGKILISLDPNVRPILIHDKERYIERLEKWVSWSNLVKMSRADLEWLYPGLSLEEMAQKYIGLGVDIVVVTLGERGSKAFTKDGSIEVPAYKVKVVDTVGAGDSFMGGLLYWFWKIGKLNIKEFNSISLKDIEEGLKFASKVAGLTCTRAGANPPYLEELD
ncbi:MAG: ribokinase [Dictyoglomus sp. NZ13-RE01]|nr:MAG: ribokinase [Dictyoglomus sp. NZ13-RE01]